MSGRVSTAEVARNMGAVFDKAIQEPVTITKHGRDRLVVLSVEEYTRLLERDRRAVKTTDASADLMQAVEEAEAPAASAQFDHELE